LHDEMAIKTSGRVHVKLYFDTWKVLEIDPFFVPATKKVL